MKTSDRRAAVNQLVLCLVTALAGGGSVGLGTVWLRHQISNTANANRALAAQIAEVERQITATKAQVDIEQSPEALRRRNEAWGLGLAAATDAQQFHVAEDPERRLALRGNDHLYDAAGGASLTVALGR